MTDLTKPVTRRAVLLTDNRVNPRNRDRVAVTLFPDGTIGFRPYKGRRTVRLPLSAVYILALREAEKEERAKKAKARRARKEGLL